ncbi:hypothetical protein [Maribacter hydrothermalis]|nr:hypothetical protein [Maribacter hydrothermalis]
MKQIVIPTAVPANILMSSSKNSTDVVHQLSNIKTSKVGDK